MPGTRFGFFGDSKVGISTLIRHYNEKYGFYANPDEQLFIHRIATSYDFDPIEVYLWDIPRHPMLERYVPRCVEYMNIIVVCYAIDDRETFNNVPKYIHIADRKKQILLLCGLRFDQKIYFGDESMVTNEEGRAMARQYRFDGFEECTCFYEINTQRLFCTGISKFSKFFYLNSKDSVFLRVYKKMKIILYGAYHSCRYRNLAR